MADKGEEVKESKQDMEDTDEYNLKPIFPDPGKDRLIKNVGLQAYLIKSGDNVGCNTTRPNKDNAIRMFYGSAAKNPPTGKYVAMQFVESDRIWYFAAQEDDPTMLVLQKLKSFAPIGPAKRITSTTDRRVFLMKPHQNSSDMMFQSMYASDQLGYSCVITVLDVNGFAELKKEESSTSEDLGGQLFKVDDP